MDQGFFATVDDAMRAVMAGEVSTSDRRMERPGEQVKRGIELHVRGHAPYVSRGGHKLEAGLKAFGVDPTGLACLDVGCSTGGFTDCLLQAGAAQVTCVDVNYGQLAWSLRQDERVRVFERVNIKTADPGELGAPFDVIVADVSFIGLASLASVFAQLAHGNSVFIGLIKPQFESQHDETDHGVVRDPAVRKRTVIEVSDALEQNGFEVTDVLQSPITGPKGNIEFLVRAVMRG